MKPHDIEKAQQRTKRYWYEDGLTEIAAGCIFFLIGLVFFVSVAAPELLPERIRGISVPLMLTFGIWLAIWLAGRLVMAIKRRLTYPRTGYVAYRRPKGALRIVSAIMAGIIGALVALLLNLAPDFRDWVPALQGFAFGFFLLYLAHNLSLVRFYLLSLTSAVAGVLASLASLGPQLGSAVYFFIMGAVLIVSGSLTLWTYFRQTEPIAED